MPGVFLVLEFFTGFIDTSLFVDQHKTTDFDGDTREKLVYRFACPLPRFNLCGVSLFQCFTDFPKILSSSLDNVIQICCQSQTI